MLSNGLRISHSLNNWSYIAGKKESPAHDEGDTVLKTSIVILTIRDTEI